MTDPEPTGAASARDRLSPRALWSRRPRISPLTLKIGVAVFLMLSANATFWARLWEVQGHQPLLLLGGGIVAFATTLFCMSVLTLPYLVRPVLILVLFLGAVASWFLDQMGVVIDRDMLQNAMNTTGNESRHLFTLPFMGHLLIFAVLPSAVVLWVRLHPMAWWRQILHYPAALALALAVFAGGMMTDYKGLSSMLRERREIAASVVPATPIVSAVRFARLKLLINNIVAAPIGQDAVKGPRITAVDKPVLTLIVVGETARAANWSLGSYDRPTNPELASRDIVYIDNVRACGTSTAVSLPCMFAHYGMENHSQSAARSYHNLLDVLQQTGFDVHWYDNNTGSLGTAARVPEIRFTPDDDPTACASGECTDAVFLPTLDKALATITRDTVIVYHQIGSHGPAYNLRYPPEFRPFPDDCRSADFSTCTQQQIINAYDNTIAYTDWFLASLIDRLGAQDRVLTSMLYVSDHGESLGEGGIYLHAAPYFMAPDVQTQVPLVLWTAPEYRAAMGLDQGCIAQKAGQGEVTHDAVFHTVLGLSDVQTSLHKPEQDLTEGCRD